MTDESKKFRSLLNTAMKKYQDSIRLQKDDCKKKTELRHDYFA